jgi:hypothetical protein
MLVDDGNAKYHVGETWSYRTRPGEEGSTLTVVKIESSPIGVIVHIYVRGLRIMNPRAPGGINTEAQHLPMAEQALEKSVTKMVAARGPLPPYEDGYRQWKTAVDGGKAGAFTVSVAEVITLAEKALNSRP